MIRAYRWHYEENPIGPAQPGNYYSGIELGSIETPNENVHPHATVEEGYFIEPHELEERDRAMFEAGRKREGHQSQEDWAYKSFYIFVAAYEKMKRSKQPVKGGEEG